VTPVLRLLLLLLRTLHVVAVGVGALFAYTYQRMSQPELDADGVERLRGEVLAETLERLGATFTKLGQILGSRPDLLGPGYIAALSRLHDRVPARPSREVERVLDAELGRAWRARIRWLDPEALAAASVAQVHRAVLDDGEEIALKVQRRSAAAHIDRDLAILEFGARVLDRVPGLQMLSLPGAVETFGRALRGQLDFRQEAANNRRFRRNFQGFEGVAFPRLVEDLCTERVLAMELVRGVKGTALGEVPPENRARLARLGAEVVLKMVFVDGFVHADMHPGNVFYRHEEVVLVDLGMVGEIPRDLLRPWAETFLAMAMQDGRQLARLFYGHAPRVATVDYAAYERDVLAHFARLYGKRLGEVEVSEAVGGIMNVLRRHRVQVEPVFTTVHVALLVAEGLGKQLDPAIDVVSMSLAYLQRALVEAPPGRPMLRAVPVA
jgi:ubiquinone biosynthesis protein